MPLELFWADHSRRNRADICHRTGSAFEASRRSLGVTRDENTAQVSAEHISGIVLCDTQTTQHISDVIGASRDVLDFKVVLMKEFRACVQTFGFMTKATGAKQCSESHMVPSQKAFPIKEEIMPVFTSE